MIELERVQVGEGTRPSAARREGGTSQAERMLLIADTLALTRSSASTSSTPRYFCSEWRAASFLPRICGEGAGWMSGGWGDRRVWVGG